MQVQSHTIADVQNTYIHLTIPLRSFTQPGSPGESDRVFIPQGPQTGDRDNSETYRVPSFDREPFKRLPEFLLPSEVKNPTHGVVMTGPQAPTQMPLPVVKLPRLPSTSPPLPQDALIPGDLNDRI